MLERVRGPDAEGVRCLDGVSTGNLGRGVAHVAGKLLERHPAVREQRRRPVTDALAPEIGEGPPPAWYRRVSIRLSAFIPRGRR